MKKGTKKNFKTAGLIALLAGLTVGGIAYNKTADTSEDKKIKKVEATLSDSSVEAIETHIKILEKHITVLKKQLETEDLNPEERFEIRQAITFAKNEIDNLQQQQKKAKNTVYFDTTRGSR